MEICFFVGVLTGVVIQYVIIKSTVHFYKEVELKYNLKRGSK